MNDRNDMVMITLDEPRELRLGHKAMKTMEKLLGTSISDFSLEDMTSEELEKVMYCLLLGDFRNKGQEINLDMMEELLDKAPNYQCLITRMGEAFAAAFPEPDPNVQGTAANGIGKKVTAKPSK